MRKTVKGKRDGGEKVFRVDLQLKDAGPVTYP